MRTKCTITFIAVFCIAFVSCFAVPARRGIVRLEQPDGTWFNARVSGDEYLRILTTADGYTLSREADGFYCYAYYDEFGVKHNSGIPVGNTIEDASLRLACRTVPYSILYKKAEMLRAGEQPELRQKKFSSRTKAVSDIRGLVILAEFPDMKFSASREDFVELFNSESITSNSGCVSRYLSDQFDGQRDFSFDIGPIVTLPQGFAYYGADNESGNTDANAYLAVISACQLSDDEIDFSLYDSDGDGVIDNLVVIVAGRCQSDGAGDDYFWPHTWGVASGAKTEVILDGVLLDRYSLATELSYDPGTKQFDFARIGTICHEYCHQLGLVDMYDTDASNGESVGLWGSTSLMDNGCYNDAGKTPPNLNAIEMEMLGIGESVQIRAGIIELRPLSSDKVFVRMDSDEEGEYFLFENRQQTGWDRYIGGSGMLVYHVNRSNSDMGGMSAKSRWASNVVNDLPGYECAHIITANPNATDKETQTGEIFFGNSVTGYKTLNREQYPDYSFRSGAEPQFCIQDISGVKDVLSLNVSGPLTIDNVDIFQDAVIVQWKTDIETFEDLPALLSWRTPSGTMDTLEVLPYSRGTYSQTIEGLKPNTTYHFVISYDIEDAELKAVEADVTTKAIYYNSLPFIYLNTAVKTISKMFKKGSRIPLRVYNAVDVLRVEWEFRGNPVAVSPDGYFYLEEDGLLEARVYYDEDDYDIILKEIKVKE